MNMQIEPYSEFGFYVSRIAALLDKRGDKLFREHLNISLRQFLLLRLVESDRHSTQQAIADRLGIAKSAVSRHTAIAQKKGWLEVVQSEVSHRQNDLRLTTEGKRLLVRAKNLIEKSEKEGFDDILHHDFITTIEVLKNILAKLQ